MGYTAWSVVYGEQPSAAKWNILGTNDASFNDGTGIADDAIKTATRVDNPYKASAESSAATSIATGPAGAQITLGTEDFDPNSNFASNVYTVPLNGYFIITGKILLTTPGDKVQYGGGFYINGSGIINTSGNNGGVNSVNFCFSEIKYLTVGTTIGLWGYQTSGSNKNFSGILTIHLLST